MEHVWQLQTAKARFSELFRAVLEKGPQRVTRQGKEAVVIMPAAQFDALTKARKGPKSIAEFFSQSPLARYKVHLQREQDFGRDIDL